MTAKENLDFVRDLLGDARMPTLDALDRVGLAHAADVPVAYLSAGQKRRVALARLLFAHLAPSGFSMSRPPRSTSHHRACFSSFWMNIRSPAAW